MAVTRGFRLLRAGQQSGDTGQKDSPCTQGAYAGNEIIHARYRDTTTGKLHVRRQQADTDFRHFILPDCGNKGHSMEFSRSYLDCSETRDRLERY